VLSHILNDYLYWIGWQDVTKAMVFKLFFLNWDEERIVVVDLKAFKSELGVGDTFAVCPDAICKDEGFYQRQHQIK